MNIAAGDTDGHPVLLPPDVGDEISFIINALTAEQVRDYCLREEDPNTIHVSHEAALLHCDKAREIPPGKIIVPGMCMASKYSGHMVRRLGNGSIFYGVKDLWFLKPLLDGESVTVRVKVERRVGGGRRKFSFEFSSKAYISAFEEPIFTCNFKMTNVPVPHY